MRITVTGSRCPTRRRTCRVSACCSEWTPIRPVRLVRAGPARELPGPEPVGDVGPLVVACGTLSYLVPQEFGLRTGTLWLELIDDDRGDRLRLTSLGGDFCWSATRYAPQALFAAGNASDLREDGRLVVCLDAAHRGSGPGHAGPTSSRSTGSDRDDTSWPTGWNWSPRCRGWRGRRRTPGLIACRIGWR